MNKNLTKIAALSVSLAMAIGVGVALGSKAAVRSVKADDSGTVTISSASSNTDGTVTVAIDQAGGSSAPITGSYGVRLYANNEVTITCSSTITSLTIPWTKNSNKPFATVTANVGTYTHPSAAGNGTWSGEATSIKLTVGSSGQVQFNAVNYTISGEDPGELESIAVTGNMTKTSYFVGESWSPAGFTVTASYDSGETKDVTGSATWTYSPAAPAVGVSSVVATASFGGETANSAAQSVTVTKTNPLRVLYGLADNTSVDVYGVYVGFLEGTGPVIMNGEYGIVCYDKTADVSAYNAGTTVLHVTGKMGTYNGLRQVASPVLAIASGTYEEPDTPVVYAAQGGETAEYASRLTTVTGTPSVISGSFDSDAGTADIKMSFDLGGSKTVQVFYKKAAQTADAVAFAAIKAAVEGEEEITIKGFTSWFNGFQVQMNGYVEPQQDYTAEQFAQDLLDQTDAICTGWTEGTNNHDALVLVWNDLASAQKYPSLPQAQKDILANANRNPEGTVVEQAMARYDFLTGKYGLTNFINGRTPVAVHVAGYEFANENNGNTMIIIVSVIAAVSALSIGALLVIKKRKHN